MCCKNWKNFLKVLVVIIFIIMTFCFVIGEFTLGAWFSFAFSLFFVLHFFETKIKVFKLGNLEIELQKSLKFNKIIGLKTAEIILFLLNNAIGVYQSSNAVKSKKEKINSSKQEILKMLSDFGYKEEDIESLKSKYIKE